MTRLFTVAASAVFALVASAQMPPSLDAAIDSLDFYVENRAFYADLRRQRIDMLKSNVRELHSDELPAYYKGIADMYRLYDVDSAYCYYHKALGLDTVARNSSLKDRINICLSSLMPLYGLFGDGMELLASVNLSELDSADRVLYHQTAADIFLEAESYYPDLHKKREYRMQALAHLDTLGRMLPLASVAANMVDAQINLLNNRNSEALACLKQAFEHIEPDDRAYAVAAAMLATYYSRFASHRDDYLYYLALSAISDIITGTREGRSLQKLGTELFVQGDVDRAYDYLTSARDNAISSGARIRSIEGAGTLSALTKTISHNESVRLVLLTAAIILLLSVCVVCGAIIVALYRTKRRHAETGRRMADVIAHKDDYIKRVLSLCSVYMEGLEEFNRFVGRKLKAGQAQDLYKTVVSGKFLQEQSERFYAVFDEAVLKIYPDFIEQLNALLLPDRRIELDEPRRFTPEVRIVALRRLGIDDAAQIAHFLSLSLNTVYTYRNRLRSRAANRDNFDSDVMNIGGFR